MATPFQSWAWLYSWWEHYKEDRELKLVTAWDGDLLVGVLPLMLERQRGFGKLLFVGTGLTDNLDLLARSGWEDRVFEASVRALRQISFWQVADLQQLRPDAAAWGIFRRWHGPRTCVQQASCPMIEVKPWDELLESLSSNLRSTARRALRRAEADGVNCRWASTADAEQAARRLVTLHRESWHGRDIGPEHLTRRFESHIIDAARRMAAREMGGISEFWRDGEVLISDFWVFKQGYLGTYMLGASQEAMKRYQWSSLYIRDAIEVARSKNVRHLDLLRGTEPYKLRWSSRVINTHRIILGRHTTSWLPYAGYHTLYSRVRQYANSGAAPPWVKSVADRYRAWRTAQHNKEARRP